MCSLFFSFLFSFPSCSIFLLYVRFVKVFLRHIRDQEMVEVAGTAPTCRLTYFVAVSTLWIRVRYGSIVAKDAVVLI